MLNNIPEDFKKFPNFVLWRYENRNGKETKVPYNPNNGYLASVTNSSTWGTFDQCTEILSKTEMSGVGFVITPELGLTCIDIDDPYGTKPDGTPKFSDPDDIRKRQVAISEAFDTYSEISPSGKGLHVWVKGAVPSGRDQFSVGLYPSGRYMTMTGNVTNPAPIREYNDLLNQLWAELAPRSAAIPDSGINKDQSNTDEQIVEIAKAAVNGEKFSDLWDGEWTRHYPSQSEADQAIINILAYYTQNREQITRIFRNSGLGKRKKAMRTKYCETMVSKSFDQQPEEVDLAALKKNLQVQFMEQLKPQKPVDLPVSKTAEKLKSISAEVYSPPAGLVGELAAFIYSAAPRPVPEIALAAAIGLMAGVCGRSYNISGSGLNLNTILLAKTGRGKEGMGGGIAKIMASIIPTLPDANIFVGPARYASPEGLLKHISKTSKSFVSVMGEFTKTLSRMSDDSRNLPQQGVKQVMLDVYNKSGKGQVLGNMVYSDTTKNTDVVTAPAFSLLAEGVPDSFYELLTEKMILEGFLSRFVIIEYLGIRQPLNKNHQQAEVPEKLKEQFGQLCAYSLQLNNSDNVIEIGYADAAAEECLDEFGKQCDILINNSSSAETELWNRGHLNALRLSGILAVGTNYITPKVSIDQAKWAIRVIKQNIENLLRKFDSGDVGVPQNQNKQLEDLKKAFRWYLEKPWKDLKSYPGATVNTHNAKVVPHSFITSICRTRASFKTDRIGPVQALRTLLISLTESGEIQELAVSNKAQLGIGKNGKVYVVLDIKSFL